MKGEEINASLWLCARVVPAALLRCVCLPRVDAPDVDCSLSSNQRIQRRDFPYNFFFLPVGRHRGYLSFALSLTRSNGRSNLSLAAETGCKSSYITITIIEGNLELSLILLSTSVVARCAEDTPVSRYEESSRQSGPTFTLNVQSRWAPWAENGVSTGAPA